MDEISLASGDFTLDSHQRIYRAMRALAEAQSSIDMLLIAERLGPELPSVGGMAYLASLTEGLPYKTPVVEFSSLIEEKARLRRIVKFASEAISRASEGEDSREVSSRLAASMEGICSPSNDDPAVSSYTVECLNRFERRRKGGAQGLKFGHSTLDALTGGANFGFNTTVAARPGVGKTALAKQAIAENRSHPIDFYSLEQTREQILWGLWSLVSGVPFAVVHDPRMATPMQAQDIHKAAFEVAEWPLRIYDRSELQIGEILASARLGLKKRQTKLIIVDYLQNVRGPGRDLRQKVSEVTSGLTALVKQEECALMVLSQLSRPGSREAYNTAPTLFDLKETSQIEQDAHTVILIHRGWDAELARLSTEGEFIVPKQRFGDTGAVPAHFNRRIVRFE